MTQEHFGRASKFQTALSQNSETAKKKQEGWYRKTMANESKLIVSFRGKRLELELPPSLTIGDVKSRIASSGDDESLELSPSSIKLMFKGKVLSDDETPVLSVGGQNKKILRFMATGLSEAEQASLNQELRQALRNAPRVRDDLTKHGQDEARRRKRMGQALNQKKTGKETRQYCFGCIETLPNLPDEHKAREILTTLANDPGVLACMAKHEWNVGSLAELYPKGDVTKTRVMGLNRNKGQQILLRLRTEDLQGFRKILSIRKVLFHELAHYVHSEHDNDFFQLMRQIERECNEMDWTQGSGMSKDDDFIMADTGYEGGSHRLGGTAENLSARELAARAAMSRLTLEEQEIYASCGCRQDEAKFLPTTTHETHENQKE